VLRDNNLIHRDLKPQVCYLHCIFDVWMSWSLPQTACGTLPELKLSVAIYAVEVT